MSNAALYIHPDAYDTSRPNLMGRHAAGESFLRGFLRHADVEAFHLWNVTNQSAADLDAALNRMHPPSKPVRWVTARGQLGDVGVVNLPVPGIAEEAWHRRPFGERAYALCGITHTTATATVMQTLSDLLVAPLHDYDALICTSTAVRNSVEAQLGGVREHLASLYGARRRAEPQRVTIPLGINADDYAVSPEQRRAWRERLDIPDDAVVALYVGRFSASGKMNPALMALALERAAKATDRPIYWVNAGWAGDEKNGRNYENASRALCPSVHYRTIDGRPPDVRFSIWSVADFFISFSENIQETFGLTPVEAMAAGLPCVVTDWNGYRDTVRHGEDGFRVRTFAPAPGEGVDLAYGYAINTLSYDQYIAAAAQYAAVDLEAAGQAIATLVSNPDLRQRLGAQAKARAKAVFDWSAVVPQYQALWAEQDARRRAAAPLTSSRENPFRPDPFRLFAGYPTHALADRWRVTATPGLTWPEAQALLTSPLARYGAYQRSSLEDVAAIFAQLASGASKSVPEAVAMIPADRRAFARRTLLWMARFGVIALTPGDSSSQASSA